MIVVGVDCRDNGSSVSGIKINRACTRECEKERVKFEGART